MSKGLGARFMSKGLGARFRSRVLKQNSEVVFRSRV